MRHSTLCCYQAQHSLNRPTMIPKFSPSNIAPDTGLPPKTRTRSRSSLGTPTGDASASIQHAGQRRLLSARDGQVIVIFDLRPAASIDTVEAGQRRLPSIWRLVALALVDIVRHCPQLRARDVVGESLTLGRSPGGGSGLCVCIRVSLVRERNPKGRRRERIETGGINV